MGTLLEAGPFSARDGEGRLLYDAVELRVGEGSLVALEGTSGSGKSSLLRQLVGLDPAPGVVRRLGDELLPPAELPGWRARVTLLAQDAPILPGSICGNLDFPFGFRHGRERTLDRAEICDLMTRAGLGHLDLARDAATLSGGERHRLALVRGLLWSPTVLVADEPLSGLDPSSAETGFELLCGWARQAGRAALAVFHDPSHAERADRRLRLAGGRLQELG
jgi:putative ABC transport system ATP-binding protein